VLLVSLGDSQISSDYDIEPVLTLTLESHPPTTRDPIYLGNMLRLFASRIEDFQKLLAKPKSVPPSIATTFGHIEPLGFERFRICELYAELLHCSNMILLNDPRGEEIVRERDVERERLRKEGHSKPLRVDIWGDTELGNGKQWATSEINSSDGSEDGDPKEEIDNQGPDSNHVGQKQTDTETIAKSDIPIVSDDGEARRPSPHLQIDSPQEPQGLEDSKVQANQQANQQGVELDTTASELIHNASQPKSKQDVAPDTQGGSRENREATHSNSHPPSITTPGKNRPVVGDYLKMQFVEVKVLPSVMDLFFAHPWNNFLHNVVYDILTQVLNGPMDKGFNRQLVVDLFTTGQLTEKILQGQRASDEAQ
jgi:hypothetical protein